MPAGDNTIYMSECCICPQTGGEGHQGNHTGQSKGRRTYAGCFYSNVQVVVIIEEKEWDWT